MMRFTTGNIRIAFDIISFRQGIHMIFSITDAILTYMAYGITPVGLDLVSHFK